MPDPQWLSQRKMNEVPAVAVVGTVNTFPEVGVVVAKPVAGVTKGVVALGDEEHGLASELYRWHRSTKH